MYKAIQAVLLLEGHNASLVQNTITIFVIPAVYYDLLVQQSFPSLDLFPHGQIIFAVLWKKSGSISIYTTVINLSRLLRSHDWRRGGYGWLE